MGYEPTPFLAPCVNDAAQDHFDRTVRNAVLAAIYQQYTDRNYGDEVYLWGAREGNERYWNQLRSGDVLLFYTETGLYTHAARVIDTELNEELGAEVYTSTDDPFSHLIYLEPPYRIDLPSALFHDLMEYGRDYPINFTSVGEERLTRIREEYGSFRAFLRDHRRKGADAPEDAVKDEEVALDQAADSEPPLTEERVRYTKAKQRVRPAAFRRAVRRHYNERCAVCGTRRETPTGTPEVEAAHIYPRSENGADVVRNGLALCSVHHWAFDCGWLSVDNDYRVLVRDAPERDGYAEFGELEGQRLYLPDDQQYHPHIKFLQEHRELHGFSH